MESGCRFAFVAGRERDAPTESLISEQVAPYLLSSFLFFSFFLSFFFLVSSQQQQQQQQQNNKKNDEEEEEEEILFTGASNGKNPRTREKRKKDTDREGEK